MKFVLKIIAAASVFVLTASSAEPFAREPRTGVYEIDVKTLMPHLEENLRYSNSRERRCVLQGDASSLFPILNHRSLSGCKLDGATRRDDAIVFQLNCDKPTVATGAARLQTNADTMIGELNVKMGGKNMTFSQRVEARRRADCEAEK
jgi:hypothetical protein